MPKSRKHLLGFVENKPRPRPRYFYGKIGTEEPEKFEYAIIKELEKSLTLFGRCDSIDGMVMVLDQFDFREKIRNLRKLLEMKYAQGRVKIYPLNKQDRKEMTDSYKRLTFNLRTTLIYPK